MLGAITGDTVGSVYEFLNTKHYDFLLFADNSSYTDDTVMTVAVADWLLRDPSHGYQTLEEVMLEYGKQYSSPMGGYGGGFHTWLFHPERLYRYEYSSGRLPYKSVTGRHPYGSWGNGSAMRASAVGWFFDTLEETERVAGISAAITHSHPEGIKGAQATAAAVWMARKGKTREEIRDYVERRFGYDLHKTYEYWHPVYEWDSSCQGTVPQGIICVLDSRDFEDAIRKAVSLGGDSDTLACITGGVAEAFYRGIPGDIVTKVLDVLPDKFLDVLRAVQEKTDYGVLCPIDDGRVSGKSEVKKKRVAAADSWQTSPMPERNVKLPMDLRLTDRQMAAILCGHIPSGMEDRWFMYCGDNKIRYFRSWTGVCIFEANFEQRYDGFEVTVLTVNQDPGEYRDSPEMAKALFCALLMKDSGEDATPYWTEYQKLMREQLTEQKKR